MGREVKDLVGKKIGRLTVIAMGEQYKNRKCGNCKYYGEHLKDDLHHCNNDKSIYKACYEMATGCDKFEQPQEGAKNDR